MSGGGSLPAGAPPAPRAPPAPPALPAPRAPPAPALSARGARIAGGGPGLLDAGFALYVADPFDRELNPQGILNFGTSENKLCFDLLEERVSAAFSLLDCNEIIAHEKCSFHFLMFLDGYLIPAPYYGGINSKTWLYGGIQPVHVPLSSEVKLLLFTFFLFQGIRVRALILINPHNPLGDIYPAQLLKECLEFAHRIYSSGIRVGVLYTRNNEIRKAVNQLAVFHSCPGPVQHVLSQFLRDRDWLDNVFFPTNKKRLKEAQNILVDGLADVGIPVLKSSGGLYVWADFRKFLKSQTFEAELELWQKLLDKKLLISPGKAFYCYEPGWFRLVFSNSVDKIYLCKWSVFPSPFPFYRYSET
uniref:Aminotransferase class I/classII large domain-containing protein n=1 Tax=Accipiter nisus TaxID=211598 RepID=A0A8B9NG63_9AVES